MNREYENQSVLTKTFEEVSHDEVSAEYNLPDYLPDINRLLKISARVCESQHDLAGDTVAYDGKVRCTVLYATGDGNLKSAEFERDFSGNTAVAGTSGDCEIRFIAEVESVSCRLQNPRKLTARLKLALATTVLAVRQTAPVVTGKLSAEDEASIESREHGIAGVVRMTVTERDTPVSEDLELDAGLPSIEEIVAVEMEPCILDVRAGDGKVVYKGEIPTAILYLAVTDDDAPAGSAPQYVAFSAKIPIAGEIAAQGVTERHVPFASASVGGIEFRPQTNAFGENRTAEIDFVYGVDVELYSNETAVLTADMYSTAYESVCEMSAISCESVLAARSFNFTTEGDTALEDGDFKTVVMASASASVGETERQGNKLRFSGEANVCVILTNGEGVYLTRNFPVPLRAQTEIPAITGAFSVGTRPTVLSVTARQDGNGIHVNLETLISYVIFEKHTEAGVAKLSVLKEKPISCDRDASLTLCYPVEQDTLWDVAKRYSTTVAALMEANGISAESVPSVLVIPRPLSCAAKGRRIL
ncbi:MAG: DUF3794 domain-containing protein [Clostridia bacterium]|nr:DUF3794 domain-containing protein [Clostridia bacterium]